MPHYCPAATGSSPILQSLPSPASKKRKASNKQSKEVTACTCPYQQASQSSNDCSCWLHNLLHAQVDASKTGNGGNGTPLFAALLPAATGSSPILQSLSMLASINKLTSMLIATLHSAPGGGRKGNTDHLVQCWIVAVRLSQDRQLSHMIR